MKQPKDKKIYVGIDQTGAVQKNGHPKPLAACAIIDDQLRLFSLPHFSAVAIRKSLGLNHNDQMIISLDCVLGIPNELKMDWRQAIGLIKTHQGFGMKVAKEFFRKISNGKIYHRQIEIKCQSNSVFREKPYQKNIQTGTYRLWKEISENEFDFFIPWLEKRSSVDQIPVFEGYPSLAWKKILRTQKREPQRCEELVRSLYPFLSWEKGLQTKIDKDANFADALVLALAMKIYEHKAFEIPPSKEGWILPFFE